MIRKANSPLHNSPLLLSNMRSLFNSCISLLVGVTLAACQLVPEDVSALRQSPVPLQQALTTPLIASSPGPQPENREDQPEIINTSPAIEPGETTFPSPPGKATVLPATLPAPPQPGQEELFPDSEIVYGPPALDFEIVAYLKQAGGYLARHQEYLGSSGWTGAAEIIRRVALENSVSPRLLLGLLEYQCNCVLGENSAELENGFVLGVEDYHYKGLYGQLWWAANQISTGYYGWKEGWLEPFDLPNGNILAPEPGTNPGSVALQYYFARLWSAHDLSETMGAETWKKIHPTAFGEAQWQRALDPQAGFLDLYATMFGDVMARAGYFEPLLPADLQQPEWILPFEIGRLWSLTSGPHKAWEREGSRAALDFAPASDQPGCVPSSAWIVAAADGQVVRSGPGLLVQDLDGAGPSDGLEQTGWSLLYMHVLLADHIRPGVYLRQGEPVGHPSCVGGPATGTHLHIARKYNGEWIAAAGRVPFVLSGWTAHAGGKPYEGTLTRQHVTVVAHPYGSFETQIRRLKADPAPLPTLEGNYAPD